MRGHISRRGDSLARPRLPGDRARTGKQRYLTRTVHGTKREAEAVCAQLVAEASRGEHGDTAAGTLADLVERWLEHITAERLSVDARWLPTSTSDKHILPALGAKRIDRLRPADLDRFYASLRGPLAPAERAQGPHDPALGARPGGEVADALVEPGGVGDATTCREAADRAADARRGRSPAGRRRPRPILSSGCTSGWPPSPALAEASCARIRWSDLDLDDGQLVVARSIVPRSRTGSW